MGPRGNLRENLKIHIDQKENENAAHQHLWDTANALLTSKYVMLNAYMIEQEKSQINNLGSHLKTKKKGQNKSKTVRRKEAIKIRAAISEIENRKTVEKNKAKKLVL